MRSGDAWRLADRGLRAVQHQREPHHVLICPRSGSLANMASVMSPRSNPSALWPGPAASMDSSSWSVWCGSHAVPPSLGRRAPGLITPELECQDKKLSSHQHL